MAKRPNKKRFTVKASRNVPDKKLAKKPVKAAVDGGWEVPDELAHDAYNLAVEYFGEEDINHQIVEALSNYELAENLAFIFRMNDFREWQDYLDERNADDDEDDEDDDIEESVRSKCKSRVTAASEAPHYELVDYFDVWGNPEDGFEVNNLSVIEDDIVIDDNATDEEILDYLINTIGWLEPDAKTKVDVEDLGDGFIEFTVSETGEPLGRLQKKY